MNSPAGGRGEGQRMRLKIRWIVGFFSAGPVFGVSDRGTAQFLEFFSQSERSDKPGIKAKNSPFFSPRELRRARPDDSLR